MIKPILTAKFKAKVEKEQNIIDSTVTDFLLNTEQERAFRIIANHASTQKPEQLIMYIGGMAGTGKSQVIKTLMAFLKDGMNLIISLLWHLLVQLLHWLEDLHITQFWVLMTNVQLICL